MVSFNPSQMFVLFIYSMILGSICLNSLSGQWKWYVVLDCCMLDPEHIAGLSGTVCQLKMSTLRKLLDASCWSQSWFHHHCTWFGCIKVHSSSERYLLSTVWMTYSIKWQLPVAINIIQFKSCSLLKKNQIPLRNTSDFSILQCWLQSAPGSLSKSNPMDGFVFAWGRSDPDCLP